MRTIHHRPFDLPLLHNSCISSIWCQDCDCVYIAETSRTLEKCFSEHTNALKKHDSNNGIPAHAWTNQHQVDWKAAKTREMEGNYWKWRVLDTLHIHQQQHTSNLDCGLAINTSWLPLLDKPACSWQISKLSAIYQLIISLDLSHVNCFNFIHNFPSSHSYFPATFLTALDTTFYYLRVALC